MQQVAHYETKEEYYQSAVNFGRRAVIQHRDDSARIKGLQRDAVTARIMVIGKFASKLADRTEAYGTKVVERYATDIDMHPNLVREARRAYLFFNGSVEELGAWIERKVEETGGVTWADVRRKIVKSIDDPIEQIHHTMTEVERAGEKLERKREELMAQISTIQDTEISDEATGVLERTAQELADGLISNYTVDGDNIGYPKNTIPRSEKYKEFIKRQPCCAHLDTRCCPHGADPAHVEMGGKGVKGSDFSMIALCNDTHRFAHANGWIAAQEKYDFNAVEQVAKHLHKFITGRDLRFPSALNNPDT